MPVQGGFIQDSRFRGYNILVTGAGSGIGAAIARLLVAEGANVTGFDHSAQALSVVSREIDSARFDSFVGDVTVESDRTEAISLATESDGVLDGLINNAGIFKPTRVGDGMAGWQQTLAIDLVAPAQLTEDALHALRRSSRASVVNIASASAHIAQVARSAYSASKAGLIALTRCQSLELGPAGIRVNSVSPGWVWTEMVDEMAGSDRATWESKWGRFSSLGRCAEPREVADAVAFLAGPTSSFITGADLAVDGGYLAMGPEADYDLPAEMERQQGGLRA